MSRLFVLNSLLLSFLVPFLASAQGIAPGPPLPVPPIPTPFPETPNPPPPEQPIINPGDPRVLVLPSRTAIGGDMDSAVIDVLLTSGLEDLGVEVVDRKKKKKKCQSSKNNNNDTLGDARSSYLDMELEDALAKAKSIRKNQLEQYGDLLGCSGLTDAELFMIQVMLDLGQKKEASILAKQVLIRNPKLRLDPAKYPPVMQAFWKEILQQMKDANPSVFDSSRLAMVGKEAGVEWVVVGTCSGGQGVDEENLSVLVVPVDADDGTVIKHDMTLGTPGHWANSVRAALAQQFPKEPEKTPTVAAKESSSARIDSTNTNLPTMPSEPIVDENKWYKSWWFWTAVGVVVVGGTAGAIGGYQATHSNDPAQIEYGF